MATERWGRHKMEGWRRGQLESFKLMSKSQAALLRAYASERIRERDSIVEAAITLVISTTKNNSDTNSGSSGGGGGGGDGIDAKAVQELLDRRKRLDAETNDLDLTNVMVDERLGEELKHLRRECRSQARKLEEVRHVEVARDHAEDEMRSKLRKTESQYSKLRGLLRGVREELAAKDEGIVVSQEDFDRLRQKYERAKAKIRVLKAEVAAPGAGALHPTTQEAFVTGDSRQQAPHARTLLSPRRESSGGDQAGAGGNALAAAAASAVAGPSDTFSITVANKLSVSAEEPEPEPPIKPDSETVNDHIQTGGGKNNDASDEASDTPNSAADVPPSGDPAANSVTAANPDFAATNAGGDAIRGENPGSSGAAAPGGNPGSSDSSGRATGEGSSEDRTVQDEREKAEAEARRLRLELAESNRRLAKAKKGKKVAEKEKNALVLAMAKELGDLEQSKDGTITTANREVQRLLALQAKNQQAVRKLAELVASERASFHRLGAEVKNRLRALPDVATVAAGAVQARVSGVEGKMAEVRRQYAREYRERRRLFNVVQELRGNIRVMCRCRPVTGHDKGGSVCTSFPGEGVIELVNERNKRKSWAFDQVFGLEAKQETVYAEVSPLVISVMDGYNACIFAYGQTGTGKTYTMMGPPGDRGVNARALEDLFTRSAGRRGEVDDTITLSILEIYNEQIRDLLIEGGAAGDQRKLEVRQGDRGNNVPGLSTVPVSSQDEVLRMLAIADRNRASACTNLNDHSSRSHLILSVRVDGVNRHSGATSAGRLHLIDLAGSERISKSGAAGQALREAQNINRSLSALGDVISARASRQAHVPYRNSTLTYLLQDSLSADSKTLMLVCVSPVIQSAEESSCSLNFAARVRTVELGKAHKHVDTGVSTPPGGGGQSRYPITGKEEGNAGSQRRRLSAGSRDRSS